MGEGGRGVSNKRTGRMPPAYPGIVAERSGGMCERCLVVPATEIHHRRYLSRGGKHNLANLLHLCNPGGGGNAGVGCHAEAHTGIGGEVGTSISRHNPRPESAIPYTDLLGRERWLDDTGLRHDRQPQPY